MKYLDLKAINKPYEHAADEVQQIIHYYIKSPTRKYRNRQHDRQSPPSEISVSR